MGIVAISAIEGVAGSDDEGLNQVAGLREGDERKMPE